jgi:hypothetical protein
MRIDFWSEWQDLNLILDEALLLHRQIKALDARRRTDIDGCEALIAAGQLLNEARTLCYHFATQLGSTGWYGREQGSAFEQNPLDNSVLAGTEQNTK